MIEYTEQMIASYQDALSLLRKQEIPEAYPEAKASPYLFGENSLDMGSFLIRDEVIRYAGYCFLAYSWIQPLAQWIGNSEVSGNHVRFWSPIQSTPKLRSRCHRHR